MQDRKAFCMEVVRELNRARTNPGAYAQELQQMTQYFNGTHYLPPGETVTLITKEGAAAVAEAAQALQRTQPLPPLGTNGALENVAQQWTGSLSGGQMGHGDFSGRVGNAMRGQPVGKMGENIAFGGKTPDGVVKQLLIDDGVAGRGHRKNILSPDFNVVGVGFGQHASMRTVCVMDFAHLSGGGPVPAPGAAPKQQAPVQAQAQKPPVSAQKPANSTQKQQAFPAQVQPQFGDFEAMMEQQRQFQANFFGGNVFGNIDLNCNMGRMGAGRGAPAKGQGLPQSEWPKGYCGMAQSTQCCTVNGVTRTKTVYTFSMPDGQQITRVVDS